MLSALKTLPLQTATVWHCVGHLPATEQEPVLLLFHDGVEVRTVSMSRATPTEVGQALVKALSIDSGPPPIRPGQIVTQSPALADFLRPILAGAEIAVEHGNSPTPPQVADVRRDLILKIVIDENLGSTIPDDIRHRFWNACRYLNGTTEWRQLDPRLRILVRTDAPATFLLRRADARGEVGFRLTPLAGSLVPLHIFMAWQPILGLLRTWPVIGSKLQSTLTVDEIESACLAIESLLAYVGAAAVLPGIESLTLHHFVPRPVKVSYEVVREPRRQPRRPRRGRLA